MKNIALLAAIAGLCIFIGCAKQESNSDQISETPENIETRLGEDLVITLVSNPTTGYSWRMSEPLPGILELAGKEFKPAENMGNIAGAGGVEEWTLKSIEKGKATVSFEYVRPWEKDKPPVKRRTFLITSK